MLEVYIYAHGTRVEEAVPSGMELIRDPEAYFSCLELRCDDIDRDLVRVIEEGTLLDGSRFLDRFGVTLYTQQLSTGCKAALMVNNSDIARPLQLHWMSTWARAIEWILRTHQKPLMESDWQIRSTGSTR